MPRPCRCLQTCRAGTVAQPAITKETLFLVERLRRYTPEIEPSIETPGTFWLNAQGLERLYANLEDWVVAIRKDLAAANFFSTIVVGSTRFGTYAVAKSIRGAKVFKDAGEENAAARCVKLDRLEIEPSVRDALDKLGIRTVADFLRLPAKGLLKRFGIEAHRLYRLAAGDLWAPLQPHPAVEPLTRQFFARCSGLGCGAIVVSYKEDARRAPRRAYVPGQGAHRADSTSAARSQGELRGAHPHRGSHGG